MAVHHKTEPLPVLGLQEFKKEQFTSKDRLLFNDLHGERHIEKPHQHDFFIMILFDQANGVHNIDFKDYQIGNQQMHLLFPGQAHRWDIDPGTTGYQLMIDRVFFEGFAPNFRFSLFSYQQQPVIQLSPQAFKLVHYEFDQIRKELESGDLLLQLIASRAAVIASIVSKAAESIFKNFDADQAEPRLVRFQQLIDIHFKEEKLVSFYAEKLHISANYLNILCKRNLKVSATQFIQQRILLEAKRLLKATTLSIKEIAFELDFADHAYFSNFFKTQTGTTPTGFRMQ
jgi:AraC family transcriptional activator of pobA